MLADPVRGPVTEAPALLAHPKMYAFVGCLVAALACSSIVEAADPVPVTVYYESLCPDSIKFYINQLFPVMQVANLSTHIDLNLVVYGKSTHEKLENGSWAFTCHHGERECYGNKVQACAMSEMTSKNERLAYLNCLLKGMLANRNIVYPTNECAEQVNIAEKAQIIECANGTKGDDLLAQMGERTQKFMAKLTSVPTVVFNNAFDAKDQSQAQTNFKGVLCKYIPDPKPAECMGSGAASLSTSLFIVLAAISLFFSQ